MVTGSTPASIGASFATSMNPSNIHPSMHPSSMGFIPGQSQPAPEFKGAMNIHIKQAKGSTIWSGESMPSDCPSSSKNAAFSPARYTCESAMDILKRFNLQEEDLEALCAYPDDQLSTANLPCLLRDIRQKKANRLSAATSSSMDHQAQGSHCAPETTLGPGADVKRAVGAPSAFQQPIKVIEYGHTSKYTVGIREEEKDRGHHSISVGPRSLIESGLMGSSTSQSRETLQKDLAQAKHGCSLSQRSTTLSPSVYSLLPSVTASPVATNIIPKRDSSANQAASAASQRPAKGTGHTSHRPALGSGTTSHKATTGPTGTNRHKPATGPGTNRHKPTPGTGTTSQSPAQGAGTTSPRPALGVGTTILRPAPATDPGPIPIPRSIPTNQGPPPASDESIQRPPPVKPADRVPTAAMISDYMGVKPDLFPHTCSLCNKPCAAMKDWLDHKKHKVHRASCQLLCRHSDPEESQQPPTTTTDSASSQSSRPSLQPTSHGGPAPSNSAPPLTRSSVDTKILKTGKSRSPQRMRSKSKSSGRKRSRSKSSGRKGSRSKSPQTMRSRSRQTKRAGSKSSGRRRSSSRKRSTSSGKANSPRSSRPIHSRSRSRSSSNSSSSSSSSSDRYHGKRPSSPAGRSRRRSGSPRRGRRSRSHSPWRRTRKSRSGSRSPHPSSQRRRSRSHDGRSSGRRQEETSVEQLAKKLLESSGVQSFTGSTSIELVVQTLAPVLLAELERLKAASSSSSDSTKDKTMPSSSSSSRDKKKPFSSSSYSDEQKQLCSSSRDEKKPSSSSSYRDEQKQSSSLSRDEKKPTSSSSSRDEKKQSSSSSRDEKKPSSSSSIAEQKQSSSLSSRDEKNQSSSSSRDEEKESSSSRDEQKQSSSSRDEQKQSSSSFRDDHKQASSSSTKGGKEPPSSSSSSSASTQAIKKVLVKKSAPTMSSKPQGSGLLGFVPAHPPLLLSGLPSTVTQQQVISAVEKLGKTRLIYLDEHRQEATVYFLQATAAKALLRFTELKIGGNPITVTKIQKSVAPKLKENPASTKPGSRALPGDKTTTPGDKTTTPGDQTTTPGDQTTTPGDQTTMPGDQTTTPGAQTTTPGDQTTSPGDQTTTPGDETTTPGNRTTTPGNRTTTPGNSTITPGNKKTTPGDETTTPGDETTTPGDETTTPGDETTTPGDETTTPSNKTTPPGDETTTPGDETTTPSNKTTPPGHKKTTPSVKMTTPGDKTTTPSDKTTTPGVKTTTPSNQTTKPSDKTTTPGDETTTPGEKTTTPGNKTTTHGDKTTMPSDTNVSIVSRLRPPVPRLHPECRISPTVLFLKSIKCIDVRSWSLAEFQPFVSRGATMIVTGLPDRARGPYRETEMIRVLEGFSRTKRDKYFILPDNCTAFVEMVANKMERLMDVLANGVPMNGGLLRCHLLKENALRSPIAFYKQLLTWSEKLYDETTLEYRLVYISNIPDDYYWMKAFHEGITKTGGVRVYLPLMGKIFVEFVTGEDADRFGVWLSSFSPDPRVENPVRVTRPGMVPDMDAIGPVRTNISHKTVVSGLQPPFWLVVPTRPHLYPTLSPQFYTPAHRTVKGPRDVEWAEISIIGQSVVMVTGLPLGGYSHLDLVNEVVPYFVEMDISRVFYSVVILPLQRRAFIHFDDGLKCKEFVSDFLHKPFTIGGSDLTLHFLLDHLKPCTSELKLYKRLLQWSHVVPKEKAPKNRLLMTAIEYCSMRALKFIFDIMETTQYLSCLVLSNRVVFQIPCETDMYNLIANLIVENDKLVQERSIYFPKPYQFQTRFKFMRSKMVPRRFQGLRKLATTTSGQSAFPHPSAPGQLAAPLRTYAPPPAAPAEHCALAHDQDWPPGSGPKPTALSQEMYCFFATAIHQHRQARVGQEVGRGGQEVGRGGQEVGRGGQEGSRGGQEVGRGGQEVGRGGQEVGRGGRKVSRGGQEASQEKVTSSGEGRSLSQHVGRSQISPLSSSSTSSPLSRRSRADGSPPPKRERRGQKSKGVSEALIEDPPGLQEEGFKPGKFIVIDEVGDEAEPIVISSYHSEACDSQTRPSHITKEKEVPSDQQVSEDVPRTSSYSSSISRGVESNTSTTAHSSSLSGATVSSSSSSSSLPPPAGVVPSSSEQNTQQKKCEESPAQVSDDDEPNSQEVTSKTTTTEVDSLPACKPITKDGSQREAAMVCEVDMARFGHMLAAETSAAKSAASLTGKDALHTDPCLEEEGKRKAQQELTLTGKDVVVSPSEDMKENRVEVDETQEQQGDEKTSDQMLRSRPECGKETPHQTLVKPETPGLPNPESQTSEPQEEGMLAKVADEAEPFQEVLLEEEKEAIVEEQTPTVVSEAADALLNGASTEEGDTHQLMDCVEGSPPREELNMGQSNEPTKEEQENSKDPTEEELTNKRATVEEGASEMEQRRSKRGNPSHPSPAIKPLSTRHSTPTRKRESPAEDPVVDSEMQEPHDDKQPAAGKRRSGRGRKEEVPVSGTSKMAAKEGQQRVKDNEEEVYQVVDSIGENHQEEAHVNSLGPARRSSLAKTRATRTCSKASKGEEPQYQVGNSKVEQEEQIPVEEQLSEEPLRGKRGRKVTGSDAKTEHEATKKRRTTEPTPTPLPDNQSEARLDSESVVSQEQMVYDEEKDSSSIIGERKQSEEQAGGSSSKARRKERGAEPKTVFSLASSVANDYTLPPFTPYNPLGMEHVVPKTGFYCNLCSVFYEDETRARTLHCSSLGHYHNLKVFYKKLKEEHSRSQSGDSALGHSSG
ncbi:unnamed protein product [Boreogadus saida]